MADFDLDRLGGWAALNALVDEVLRAGEDALRVQRTAKVEQKSDASPVTEADRMVEARLRSFLLKTFPDAGFLGEESGKNSDKREGGRFIVDPIDGTRAFIRGLDTWSILVGYEDASNPAIPALGVALMPAAGDLFVAVRGAGVTMNGRPCRVSEIPSLGNAMVGTGGGEQFKGREPLLSSIVEHAYSQRAFGDFANYRALLQGRMDVVVDPGVAPWDICAAALMVREAGGRYTDLQGTETIYGDGGLASNGHVHGEVLALTRA